jgi:hypothetical protein
MCLFRCGTLEKIPDGDMQKIVASVCLGVYLCSVGCNNKGNPNHTMIVLLPASK